MLGIPNEGTLGVKVTDYPLNNGYVRRYFTVTNMRELPEYDVPSSRDEDVPSSRDEATVTLYHNAQTLDYVFGETWYNDMVPVRHNGR